MRQLPRLVNQVDMNFQTQHNLLAVAARSESTTSESSSAGGFRWTTRQLKGPCVAEDLEISVPLDKLEDLFVKRLHTIVGI